MKTKKSLVTLLALAFTLPVATLIVAQQAGAGRNARMSRPEGPCDIYAAAGDPCVAAHSSTRALSASYNGPLYQVMRQSDGAKLDIGVVQPTATDPGGYADAAAQDAFCANTYCWITKLYDQSGHGNDLVQAPHGGFSGPAMGGFNNVPVADWAPVTVMGHKVYGVFIAPGMGLRWNDAHGTAVDDQAEGQYWVVDGHHFNGGCCYDYGNAETDSRDDGDGTMETTYFGNATPWYHGPPPGPWVMSDQENNLVGCVTDSPNNKFCADLPIITWRFVTAMMDGEPHHWRTMGGDAQQGDMKIMYDGQRVQNPRNTYDPMRKQGAILLGNGGDNSNGSQGTFYEGAMTAAGTFPSQETNQKIHANVVAARYDVQRLNLTSTLTSASASPTTLGLQTFSPGSSQFVSLTFKNTARAPITGLKLNISAPEQWTCNAVDATSAGIAETLAPGASVSITFKITSGPAAFNGDLVGNASWTDSSGQMQSETAIEKVRNTSPVKINEFAINPTDSFIELYNAGDSDVDLSGWTLTQHPTQQAIFSSVKIPAGTKLAAKGFYLLGLSDSGLVVPAQKGDATIYVRSTTGMSVGDSIEIGTGLGMETRKIAALGAAAGSHTTLWQPLPDGPVITIPAGSTNVPYTGGGGGFGGRGGGGFAVEAGQKLGLGYGATYPAVANTMEKYEVVTVTEVGKPGTQTRLAADAKVGDTSIRVMNARDISPGDQIRLDIDSKDHGIETVTVKSVGEVAGGGGGGGFGGRGGGGASLELEGPLKFNHAANIPLSVRGTGISFQPATTYPHSSNEPLQPLGTGITLDSPLANDHDINAVVRDAAVTTAGYQGPPKPDQWFGGPALANDGNMVLRDSAGHVADSLNYGAVVDPWAAEGYQGASPGSGNYVATPSAGRGGFFGRRGGPAAAEPRRSAGRFPDGADTDNNQKDFHVQTDTSLAASSAAGAENVKVASVAGFDAGQRIIIDTGANQETAVIAKVGTAGATTVGTATEAGATVIPVANAFDFNAGQTITIDSGANQETAVVASINRGRRGGFGGFGRGGGPGGASITVTSPLAHAHAVDAQVSGSGITFTAGLTKAHESGVPVAGNVPTPGAPNQYAQRN
ncbi:MAG TPA: arabinofuranosidase catalytic domain-containing protein [Verrucomicrobiae bacterium]|nr:arabinofuranosidase catalytic domain-containing protein [Verrucomicrobiae bacterium]